MEVFLPFNMRMERNTVSEVLCSN